MRWSSPTSSTTTSSSPATAISARWSRRCSGAARKVTVVSTLTTQPPMISDDLRRQADHFIDLSTLKAEVGRDPSERPVAPARAGRDDDDDL